MTPEARQGPAARAGKAAVDPWRPLGTLRENERLAGGGAEDVLTVFLAGAECPFGCVFCDLWRHTLDGATPPGALPEQLAAVLTATESPDRVKLYNASNFFEDRAVPPQDDPALARLLAGIAAVTVECHPRLVGRRCFEFSQRLDGRLEVAMGLETVHPGALPRLGKAMTLADFDRAAAALSDHDIDLRAFVLLGVPFVPAEEQIEWAVRAVHHAAERGARHVALIPVRPGTPDLERLAERGEFVPCTLADLETSLERCLTEVPDPVVTVDLWDAARFAECAECSPARLARLATMNSSGCPAPCPPCGTCGWGDSGTAAVQLTPRRDREGGRRPARSPGGCE